MLFIPETNAASDPIKPRPNVNFGAWLAKADPATVFVTVTTIAELEYGMALARRAGNPRFDAIERDVSRVTQTSQILDLDKAATLILGRMWAEPTLQNFTTTQPGARRIQRGSDLQIAAIALRHDATLVTRNTQDFIQIGRHFGPLRLFDPFTAAPP